MKGQPSCWCPKKNFWGIELFSHFTYRSQYWDNSITLASVIPKQKTHLCMTCNFFFLGRDENLLTWNLEPPAQKAMHQPTVQILPSTAITIFFLKLTLKLVKTILKWGWEGGGGVWKGLFFTCLHFFHLHLRKIFNSIQKWLKRIRVIRSIQSNLSNMDTEGTEQSVCIREVSIWKRSLWWRHFYYSTYSFKCSVAKTRLTLIFKLHLKLLTHSTKTTSFHSIQHCTSQLQTNYCFKQNKPQCNAACKKW